MNRRIVVTLLKRRNYQVTAVCNGLEAVVPVRTGSFDLILMDVQMPEMDGLAAAQAIRAAGPGQCVPIVAITAGAMKSDRDKCATAGMDEYVSKPFKGEELFAKIDLLVQNQAHKLAAIA